MKTIGVLAMALSSLLVASTSLAGVVYIDAAYTGGSNDGSIDYPFTGIQEGLNAAIAGDVVSVAPGIYYGEIELIDNVQLVSQEGPTMTVIDGMGAPTVVKSAYAAVPHSYIEGFTIRNGTALIFAQNRHSFWTTNYFELHNCVLQDGGVGIYVYPRAWVTGSRLEIKDIAYTAIDGIWSYTPRFDNLTIDSVNTAVKVYQIVVNLYNSTITNTENVFATWGDRGFGYIYGSNNNVYQYVNYSVPNNKGVHPQVNITGTLQVDPLFVGPPNDFSLQETSPLIDAGVDVGLPYVGLAPDIGAYEFGEASLTALAEGLAESYSKVSPAAFKNAGEQRRHALTNKVIAVLHILNNIDEETTPENRIGKYEACINKLENDILSKGDGFHGGNPNNDWIVTQTEQDELHAKVTALIAEIQEEIYLLTQ